MEPPEKNVQWRGKNASKQNPHHRVMFFHAWGRFVTKSPRRGDLFRSCPALGFSDCLILQFARRADYLPLGTFDAALGKIEGVQKLH